MGLLMGYLEKTKAKPLVEGWFAGVGGKQVFSRSHKPGPQRPKRF